MDKKRGHLSNEFPPVESLNQVTKHDVSARGPSPQVGVRGDTSCVFFVSVFSHAPLQDICIQVTGEDAFCCKIRNRHQASFSTHPHCRNTRCRFLRISPSSITALRKYCRCRGHVYPCSPCFHFIQSCQSRLHW